MNRPNKKDYKDKLSTYIKLIEYDYFSVKEAAQRLGISESTSMRYMDLIKKNKNYIVDRQADTKNKSIFRYKIIAEEGVAKKPTKHINEFKELPEMMMRESLVDWVLTIGSYELNTMKIIDIIEAVKSLGKQVYKVNHRGEVLFY